MDLNVKNENIVFIEKNVFLEDGFYSFLENLLLKTQGQKLSIYIEENLKQAVTDYKKTSLYRNAYTIEGFIDLLNQKNLLHLIVTRGYFELSEISEIIKNNQTAYVLLLTQKENIYKSLKLLKEKYDFISIAKLAGNQLSEWKKTTKQKNDAFYLEKDNYISKVDIEKIDYVYSPIYGHLKLDKSKSFEGGEGILYSSYNNLLCKLYFDEHQTYVNYKKLQHMSEIDIYNPYINWPKDILYYKNDFVGYAMEEIKGALSLDVLRINMFEGYNIFDLYVLSYNLLLKINYLHQKDILIGDLKLDNILVKSPEEVYLVDCGCYQIKDYPCVVCHPEYTKKNYTSIELKKTLRATEEEYYPINKILFEILIGKNPNYMRDSGEIDVENKDGFHFPLDLNEIKDYTHELKMWARLSNRMREYFYYYFKENKITYLSEWIQELKIFIDNANKRLNKQKVK